MAKQTKNKKKNYKSEIWETFIPEDIWQVTPELIAWASESIQIKFKRARRIWSDHLPSTREEQLKSLKDLVWLTEQGYALAATILFDLLERGIIVPNL